MFREALPYVAPVVESFGGRRLQVEDNDRFGIVIMGDLETDESRSPLTLTEIIKDSKIKINDVLTKEKITLKTFEGIKDFEPDLAAWDSKPVLYLAGNRVGC